MLNKAKHDRLVWLDIIITLCTYELMAYFYYGIRTVVLAGVCIAAALVSEIISLRFMGHRFTADDLTCTSDALITALMVPAVMDMKAAAIAVVFSVIAAKNIFGGRWNMIFSPSAAAYVFMLTSWKTQVLQFTAPHVHTAVFGSADELVNSASHTFNISGSLDYTSLELIMGNFPGPSGSGCVLLLAVSAIVLLFRRDISAGAFIGSIAGTVAMCCIAPDSDTILHSVVYTFITNMVLFASVYVIADRRIAPRTPYFAFFYGLFIAVISYIVVLTTAKENAIIIVSLLFTPAALGLRNLEKRIEAAAAEEKAAASDAGEEVVAGEQ